MTSYAKLGLTPSPVIFSQGDHPSLFVGPASRVTKCLAGASRGSPPPAAAPAAAGATGLLALGKLARSRQILCANVLTKDASGKFRFAESGGSGGSGGPEASGLDKNSVAFEKQPGVSRPWGFYDPLNFCKSGLMTFPEEGDPTGFQHLRNAELKHGRFAMMAATGSLFACYVKLPRFENVPSGLAALDNSQGANGFALLIALISLHEMATWKQGSEPSSYDPLRDASEELVTKELNNGRLAMFAIAGQIAGELLTGQDPAQQFVSWACSYPKFV